MDTVSKQTLLTDGDCDTYIEFKIPLVLPESSSINFPNCGEYNYEANTVGYNWTGTSCPAGANLDTEDSRYSRSDLGDNHVAFATQYNQEDDIFTTGSINNRLTKINWEEGTAYVYARSLGTFTVVVESKTSVDPNNFVIPTIDSTDDDDDYDAWEEFNATYLASILLGLTLVYVAIAYAVDKKYKPQV